MDELMDEFVGEPMDEPMDEPVGIDTHSFLQAKLRELAKELDTAQQHHHVLLKEADAIRDKVLRLKGGIDAIQSLINQVEAANDEHTRRDSDQG